MAKEFFVLVAEDEEQDIFLLQRALQKAGIYSLMHVVHNGAEAIDYLAGRKQYSNRTLYPLPDMVLVDLKMPIKNGFEVLEWIRECRNLKALPAVVLTASTFQKDVDRAFDLGANAYLVKRSDVESLGELLKNLHRFWENSTLVPQRPLPGEARLDSLHFLGALN